MKRILTLCVACAVVGGLLLATGSSATPTELGDVPPTATPTMPTTVPSCPTNPCYAVSRTTGYQAKVGSDRGPMVAPGAGRIVAWSIALGAPTTKQVTYFDANEGGDSSAGIAVLAPGSTLHYTLVGEGPIEALQPYFGETVQFALPTSIPVKKGDVIALTVPTWAPALALNFGNDTSWRASRGKTACGDTTTQTAQESLSSVLQYYCLYRTARLTYTATFIPNPVPTVDNTTSTTTTSTTASTTDTSSGITSSNVTSSNVSSNASFTTTTTATKSKTSTKTSTSSKSSSTTSKTSTKTSTSSPKTSTSSHSSTSTKAGTAARVVATTTTTAVSVGG